MKFKILITSMIIDFVFALPVLASHDPNTTDADCPSSWQPQYGVTCGDPSKPEACGVSGGVPQCIATGALPTGTCNVGSVRVNCDNCTASCACSVSGNIVCSGGSPATFGNCQGPQSCGLAGRVTANQCTGTCGGCASGFEDLTPATSNDPCTSIRPKVTLAPPDGFPDADITTDSSLYINKTGGTGNLVRLQRGGTDRVIVTNSGHIVLGLASDWNTFTQTLGAGENLIYGGVSSASVGNILKFERRVNAATKTVLFQLDSNGNLILAGNLSIGGTLTVGGATVLTQPAQCNNGESLLWNAATSAWECGTAGLAQETDPVHAAWLTAANPTIAKLTVSNDLTVGNDLAVGNNLTLSGALTADSISATTVNATGCFGPTFQQPSQGNFDGDIDGGQNKGYLAANSKCPAGMHVCKTSEILESINCGAFAGKDTNNAEPMWIANLAPSLPTPTNDCGGWQTASSNSEGVAYGYTASGGSAGTASCDSQLPFACCR